MIDRQPASVVISEKQRLELQTRMEELDAQRVCLRITDKHWGIMKERARRSTKPLTVALQSELDRCAVAIAEHYKKFLPRQL